MGLLLWTEKQTIGFREAVSEKEGKKIGFLVGKTKTNLSVAIFCPSISYREKMGLDRENGNVLVDSGRTRLHELGYKQELKRDLS